MAEQVSRIIIKTSTANETPLSGDLHRGELGYSYKSDRLFIGSEDSDLSYVVGGKFLFELFDDVVDENGVPQFGKVFANNTILAGPNKDLDELDILKLKLNGEELLTSANSLNLFQTIDSLSVDNTLSSTSDTQLATSKAIKDYIDVKTDIISDFINGTPLPGQILVGNDQNKFEYVTSNGAVEFFANGYSTLRNSTVENNMLANSFINIGTQRIDLGNTTLLDLNDISSSILNVSTGGTGRNSFEKGSLLIGNSNSSIETSANLLFDTINQVFSVYANTILSNVTIENNLVSNGTINLNGTAVISGNTSIDGNTLQISNNTETTINGNTYFNGEEVSYSNGTDLNVNGTLNINGDFLNTSPNTTIYSQGDILVDDGTLTTTEDSTVNFNSSQINFNSTTNTQINGNVSIDGNLTSDGNTTFNEVVTFNKSPNFTTDVTIAKNLNVEESVYVIGDLFVSGNTVTVEASRVAVEDNILLLGANNTSDLVDLGFVGQYYNNRYAGLVRSALDDKFYLIEDYYPEPDDTVHNFDANTMFATLRADVEANTLSTEIAVIDELTSQNITSNNIVSNSLTTSSVELDVLTVDEINSSNTITINSDVELFENLTVKANTDELGNRTTVDFERDTVFRSSGLFEFHGETFYVNPWVPNIIMGKAFTISGGNVVSFFDQTSQSGYVNTSFTESFTVVSNTQNTFTSNNLPSTFDINFNYLTATLNGNLIHNPNDYTISNNVITLVQDAVLNDVLVINYVDPNSVNESNANTINTAVEFSSKLVSTSANTKLEVLGVADFETLLANNATINNLSVEFSTANNIIANTVNAVSYNGIYLDMIEDVNASATTNQVLTADGLGGFYFSESSVPISVRTTNTSNAILSTVTNVSDFRFDSDSGFDVVDLGSGAVKIQMNSTFKTLKVDGEQDLIASGLDTLELVAGPGIVINTDPTGSPYKTLTFSSPSALSELTDVDSSNTVVNQLMTTDGNGNYFFKNFDSFLESELIKEVYTLPSTQSTVNLLHAINSTQRINTYLNGVRLFEQTDYTLDYTNNAINFATTLAANSVVNIDIFTNGADYLIHKEFATGGETYIEYPFFIGNEFSTNLFYNGLRLSSTEFTEDSANNRVLLNFPVVANDILELDFHLQNRNYEKESYLISTNQTELLLNKNITYEHLLNVYLNGVLLNKNVSHTLDYANNSIAFNGGLTANDVVVVDIFKDITPFKLSQLSDVNPISSSGDVLVSDGSGGFYFNDINSFLSSGDSFTIENNSFIIDSNTEFVVSGNTSISGDSFNISNNTAFTINGTTIVGGDTFNISSNTTFNVDGSTTLNGNTSINGDTFNINSNTEFTVDGSTTLNGNTIVNGDSFIIGSNTEFRVEGSGFIESLSSNTISANSYSGMYLNMLEDVDASNVKLNQLLTSDGNGNYLFRDVDYFNTSDLNTESFTLSATSNTVTINTDFNTKHRLNVYVNGVRLYDQLDYTLDYNTNKIYFVNSFSANTEITVDLITVGIDYTKGNLLVTSTINEILFPINVNDSYLTNVYVNGLRLNETLFNLDYANNKVIFNNNLAANDIVEFDFYVRDTNYKQEVYSISTTQNTLTLINNINPEYLIGIYVNGVRLYETDYDLEYGTNTIEFSNNLTANDYVHVDITRDTVSTDKLIKLEDVYGAADSTANQVMTSFGNGQFFFSSSINSISIYDSLIENSVIDCGTF